ncbi:MULTISPECIES: type IV secretion system DNA-binding domain-containing protein [unclassified Herbaspirillum]|uniref:type IV secretion system DNA-binding domain-containing protein n=1 Tax=unclassified Herbaspirillum TaxID=2624150 RepID=UPI000E2EFBD1|nr:MULTISPECIES: type IV secretion system DNA-binding domain-containing protein [unclassified Herbaspirillum]RFB72944.1 DUF87 domain-containing protein [Herbaspirillum sp. 3R-3a1]TFI11245.1 DUF87 domain-containing protein [Herbaspirillum sp. 3R11]TFI17154.1 DUF87 domain-containing protein [Herbaspirillum sp. 3R-11]TFI28891.1 DUF87 domain-containing protein [Herbaspirillum sp. 3C11]
MNKSSFSWRVGSEGFNSTRTKTIYVWRALVSTLVIWMGSFLLSLAVILFCFPMKEEHGEFSGLVRRLNTESVKPGFQQLNVNSENSISAFFANMLTKDEVQIRLLLSLIASSFMSVGLARNIWKPKENFVYLRGPRRYDRGEAVFRLNKKLKEKNNRHPDVPLSPSVAYPGELWREHMLICGGVGAGKSTAIKPIVNSIIERDEQLLLFDPKGDFTQAFDQPSIIAPWDSRSCAWDIGKDLRGEADMAAFAEAMIKETSDPMWSSGSRQIFVGYMKYLRATYGRLWGWKELADMLDTPIKALLPIMQRHHREAVRSVEKMSVTTQGLLITLASFCSPVYTLALAWADVPEDRKISFVEWMTAVPDRHRQIIFQGHGKYPHLVKAFVPGILAVIAGLVSSPAMDDTYGRKYWFIADEAAEMGNVPIRTLFSMGRSRNFRCLLACQDFSQLEEIYGKAMVNSLLSMCKSTLIGRMGPGETAEMLSKWIGSQEVEYKTRSSSRTQEASTPTVSTSYVKEDVVLYKPQEFSSRFGNEIRPGGVVMSLVLEGDAYELFWPHVDYPKKRPAHVPAKWMYPKIAKAMHVEEVAEKIMA